MKDLTAEQIKWLDKTHPNNDGETCGFCKKRGTLVPFGTRAIGFFWLHPLCWQEWFDGRVKAAKAVLL